MSVQGGKTYVYFTVNSADSKDYVNYSAGGGVYRYTLSDAEATQIYDAAGHYQYCDSPVIADASGNLYYINDSGTLFKLELSSLGRLPLTPTAGLLATLSLLLRPMASWSSRSIRRAMATLSAVGIPMRLARRRMTSVRR